MEIKFKWIYLCSIKQSNMNSKQQIRLQALATNLSKLNVNAMLLKAGVNGKHLNLVYQDIVTAATEAITVYNEVPKLKQIIASEISFYFGSKQVFC